MAPALAITWMVASIVRKRKWLDPDGEIVQFRYPGRARLNSINGDKVSMGCIGSTSSPPARGFGRLPKRNERNYSADLSKAGHPVTITVPAKPERRRKSDNWQDRAV
jgi:hypothetical protein